MDPAQGWLDRVQRTLDEDGRPEPGPLASWEVFPFEREGLRAKPIATRVVPEPDRSKTPGECKICAGVRDPDRLLYGGERLLVVRVASTSLMFGAQVVTRAHEAMEDLGGAAHAELGVLIGRTFDALRALPGVGRVHVNKWENGTGHLMFALNARPAGVLELRGSHQPIWADMLPAIPEAELAARAVVVRRTLARE